jgi:DNA-binding winged helix-turn-helix (wHTH) protein
MADGVDRNLQFGPFELSRRERVLRREGVVLPLGSRALDLLIYLAERPGEVIAKQELRDQIWSDVTVEEGSLRVHVAAIRKALGDGQFGNRYIANIKGRGYSFVGSVVRLDDSNGSTSKKGPAFPARLSRMIGRDAAVDTISAQLVAGRFVTIVGAGGIGKTTVAGSDANYCRNSAIWSTSSIWDRLRIRFWSPARPGWLSVFRSMNVILSPVSSRLCGIGESCWSSTVANM